MADRPGRRPAADDGASSAVLRPPRAPLAVIGTVAVLTLPLALIAVASGDVVLGLAASLSAGWAACLAAMGWSARTVINAEGVVVRWLRSTEEAAWANVIAVEVDRAGPGRAARGARVRCADRRVLRLAPWLPILWFARRAAAASLDQLSTVLATIDAAPPITDPDADDDRTHTGPRRPVV